ncbi:MAG: hypothetical protein IPP88_25310 [Betaproteobacteria bacterium]|nr:hypothetical protein [Betaproteobacteria bacterium]
MEYAIRRFRDPANRSPYEWLFENKVLGLDEAAEKAKKEGKFDYDTPIEGLKVLDKYTLQIRLRSPDYNFLYFLAMPNVVPISREVIEGYKDDTMGHPVGTGPYLLKEWTRRSKIVLEKNPGYRGHTLSTEFANADDPWDREAIKALAGKTLPLIDRVEIFPIEQEQPRYLAFINFEHDFLEETPFEFVEQVLPNGKLAPNLAKARRHCIPRRADGVHLRPVQHERPGAGRPDPGQGGAAARDGAGARPGAGDRHHPPQAGDSGAVAGAAGGGGV